MRTFLFIITLVLFSCGIKNTNTQMQDTKQTNSKEIVVHSDTSFVTVFLDIDFSGEVPVFDKPSGKVIKTLKNNIDEENFIMFDLLEKNDSMLYIIAYLSLDKTLITKGWIYKNTHLGIYSSTYNRNFVLYRTSHNKKEVIAIHCCPIKI